MKNQIDEAVKGERLERLQALLLEQHAAFNAKFLGRTVDVLLDS